jgi:hypothetical protein
MGRNSHKYYHVNEVHPCITNGSGDGQLTVSHATQATHGFTYSQRTKVFTNIVSLIMWHGCSNALISWGGLCALYYNFPHNSYPC